VTRCLILVVGFRGQAIRWRQRREQVSKGRCHGNHFWLSIYGVHISTTWRIRLSRPCAALHQITMTTCYCCYYITTKPILDWLPIKNYSVVKRKSYLQCSWLANIHLCRHAGILISYHIHTIWTVTKQSQLSTDDLSQCNTHKLSCRTHNGNDTPHHLNTRLLNYLEWLSVYELNYNDIQVLQLVTTSHSVVWLHWLPVRQRIAYKTAGV